MEKLLERIYYGLQFSPSTTYSFGSTWNSKKTQKKIEKTPSSYEFGVYTIFLEINT